MTDLSSAVVSITRTTRGRFFWAAWWTGAPSYSPFRKPDASNGGSRSEADAQKQAERIAGRHLTTIEPYWARAFNRMLRGESPPPPPSARPKREERPVSQPLSSRDVLGVSADASIAEIKRAYRRRALELHPDRGGDADAFLALTRAFDKLVPKKKR